MSAPNSSSRSRWTACSRPSAIPAAWPCGSRACGATDPTSHPSKPTPSTTFERCSPTDPLGASGDNPPLAHLPQLFGGQLQSRVRLADFLPHLETRGAREVAASRRALADVELSRRAARRARELPDIAARLISHGGVFDVAAAVAPRRARRFGGSLARRGRRQAPQVQPASVLKQLDQGIAVV